MPATKKKSSSSSRTKAKLTLGRKKTGRKSRSGSKTKSLITWLIVTLIVIIFTLITIIYFLLNDRPAQITPIKTIPTEPLKEELQPTQKQQKKKTVIKDKFKVNFRLEREITAHVLEYRIDVYKNSIIYTSLLHQSAPIEKIWIKQSAGQTILTVEAIDQVSGQSYKEIYRYLLDDKGNYTVIE